MLLNETFYGRTIPYDENIIVNTKLWFFDDFRFQRGKLAEKSEDFSDGNCADRGW